VLPFLARYEQVYCRKYPLASSFPGEETLQFIKDIRQMLSTASHEPSKGLQNTKRAHIAYPNSVDPLMQALALPRTEIAVNRHCAIELELGLHLPQVLCYMILVYDLPDRIALATLSDRDHVSIDHVSIDTAPVIFCIDTVRWAELCFCRPEVGYNESDALRTLRKRHTKVLGPCVCTGPAVPHGGFWHGMIRVARLQNPRAPSEYHD
jgi:hypothetical protein